MKNEKPEWYKVLVEAAETAAKEKKRKATA